MGWEPKNEIPINVREIVVLDGKILHAMIMIQITVIKKYKFGGKL